ncbi:hypothetical protein UCD39_05335 [Nitrospirillum sp. BR 11752]|uniref:hypothetical protein n=1 Tax=Nitrospirillum sp. BR 11752 TaxID=3104293 RepID=UPI002EB3F0CE|nr:hypothetical protein [Nitrospirillum sp. BR 11752]
MLPALISVILLGAVLLAAPAQAQDRRAVSEPSLPAQVCATLSPSPASTEGRWPEETQRLQSAINHCSSGGAVHLVADGMGGVSSADRSP